MGLSNVLVSHRPVVHHLLTFFDEHFDGGHAREVDPEWLKRYWTLWEKRKTVRAAAERIGESARRLKASPGADQSPPRRLKGFSFAFTGGIPEMPRVAFLYPLVERYDGHVVKNPMAIPNADCLVHGQFVGDRKTTRKLRAARRAGIPIVSADEFLAIIKREKRLRKGG